jgi:uncharacterized protein YybS (DUF2232 family)
MIISNIIGCTGAVIFFLLVSVWVPLVGPLFSLLIPLPFLYYLSKSGSSLGWKTGLISLLIIGLIARLAGYPQLILFCIVLGVIGLIISEIFKREFTFGLTILWGTVLVLFIGAVFLFFIGLSKGTGAVELIVDYLQGNVNRSISLYEEMGLDQETTIQLRQFGTVLNSIIARIYPALLVIGAGVIIWINVVVSKPLFRLGRIKYPDLGRTDMWHAPEFMVWGVIAAGFSLFFPITGIKFIALNTLIVLLVIYVFHGLSIIMFFFNRHNIPLWARFGVYLLIMVQLIFLVVLALAGLFDQWIDFRKIHKKGLEEIQ